MKNKNITRVITFDSNDNVVNDFIIHNNEEIQIVKKNRQLTDEQKRIVELKKEKENWNKELGGFVTMYYIKNELLFSSLELDLANISRIIYLATYMDYNSSKSNLLIKHGKNNKIEPLNRKDIGQLLNIKDRTLDMFLKNVKENNLLFEEKKMYYINPEYFTKGDVKFNPSEYTRLYINTVRDLYERTSPRQHKQLSYIFQLVPKLHYETNILCHNPYETDLSQVKKMNLKDIAGWLNVNTDDNKNTTRLKKDLLKYYLMRNGEKHYALKYVIVQSSTSTIDYFVVNPEIVWAGNNIEQVKEIVQLQFFQDETSK